jgi:hypothetical protein
MTTRSSKSVSTSKAGISFPVLQSWNPMTEFATIAAQVDGRRVLCRISKVDLQKKFDAPADNPMDVLTEHRAVVEDAARKRIEDGDFEKDGSILIRYKDL